MFEFHYWKNHSWQLAVSLFFNVLQFYEHWPLNRFRIYRLISFLTKSIWKLLILSTLNFLKFSIWKSNVRGNKLSGNYWEYKNNLNLNSSNVIESRQQSILTIYSTLIGWWRNRNVMHPFLIMPNHMDYHTHKLVWQINDGTHSQFQ